MEIKSVFVMQIAIYMLINYLGLRAELEINLKNDSKDCFILKET